LDQNNLKQESLSGTYRLSEEMLGKGNVRRQSPAEYAFEIFNGIPFPPTFVARDCVYHSLQGSLAAIEESVTT
jgi:hypothetical protein